MKYKNIYRDMCNRYGAQLPARFKKLFEECDELKAAVAQFEKSQNVRGIVAVFDELGDVAIILMQICYIVGVPFDALLEMTHNKITERDKNPNYKR